MRRWFRDRRVLVTGGSSGIGRSTALLLARYGARVVIVARRERLLRETAAAAPGIRWTRTDVTNPAGAVRAVQAAKDALGGLDIVINSAGAVWAATFEETPARVFNSLFGVNVLGTVHITRAALPGMVSQGFGHFVNVASLAASQAVYGYTAYAATKHAVVGFSEALRQELRPRGVAVSVVLPPDVDTPQLAGERRHRPAATEALAGTGAVLSPDGVARSILAGIARGRPRIVPGHRARFKDAAARHVPGIVRSAVDRIIARSDQSGR